MKRRMGRELKEPHESRLGEGEKEENQSRETGLLGGLTKERGALRKNDYKRGRGTVGGRGCKEAH